MSWVRVANILESPKIVYDDDGDTKPTTPSNKTQAVNAPKTIFLPVGQIVKYNGTVTTKKNDNATNKNRKI
jgi:hypothetical protein